MFEQIRSSAEYNRRAAIIEGLRAGRSQTEIIRFFGTQNRPYMMLQLNIWLRRRPKRFCQPDEEEPFERKVDKGSRNYRKGSRAHFRRPRAVSDKISKNLECEYIIIRRIAKKDLCFKSYVIKVRQMFKTGCQIIWKCFDSMNSGLRTVQIWIRWTTTCGLLRHWTSDKQIETSQRDISPGCYRGIRHYGQERVAESVPALQDRDQINHRSKRRLYRVILLWKDIISDV